MNRLLALPILILAACTSTSQTTGGAAPLPPPPPATTASASSIIGDYSVTISPGDLPAGAPAEGLVGMWVIAFHGGNHFVGSYNGQEVIQGHYQVNGNQLMFGEGETGPYACNTPATYTWTLSGNQLRLTRVGEDACNGRAIVLAARPLTRAP